MRASGRQPELQVAHNRHEVARLAAACFLELGCTAITSQGVFRVALSGGSTPRALHAVLSAPINRAHLDWSLVEFYFGDERCVTPDHPDSNFGMAQETLFGPLGISPSHIFRMRGEADPHSAAREYETIIRERFHCPNPQCPSFDLIVLGLGDDGHTASLFPHTPELAEDTRLVVATKSPRGIANRLTCTLSTINHAKAVIFLVSGLGKAQAVKEVFNDVTPDPSRWPAKLVRPLAGCVVWFLDRESATSLPQNLGGTPMTPGHDHEATTNKPSKITKGKPVSNVKPLSASPGELHARIARRAYALSMSNGVEATAGR